MSTKAYVSYKEFGAVGDGVTNDFAAIRAAHAYANENGIAFCCLDASASFHEADKRRENTQEALDTVCMASECNIPYIPL